MPVPPFSEARWISRIEATPEPCDLIGPKNTNSVEDVEYLRFVNFRQILWVPVKCETKQKRNGTKLIETKRNKSKRNETNNMASHC